MKKSRVSKKILITHCKGIHTRVAAFIAYKASQINNKYNVKLLISKTSDINMVPISSMLILTSLNIKYLDEIFIACEGTNNIEDALSEIIFHLKDDIELKKDDIDIIDDLIDKNTLTSEQLVESISNGVVVVNEKNEIILFNHIAEKIVSISRDLAIGRNVNDVIPGSKLKNVLDSKKPMINDKQVINDITIITNRTPIIINNEICGAIAIFQNISEIEKLTNKLESVNNIKNTFGNMLETFSEGVCLIDLFGQITYTNYNFMDFLNYDESVIKQDINILFPQIEIDKLIKNPDINQVFNIKIKNNKILITISSIYNKSELIGFMMVVDKELHIRSLVKQLKNEEERSNYFKEELLKKEPLDKAFDQIIGSSNTLHEVMYMANKASKTSATVLIYGESGTGKELIVKAIVGASDRKDKPFIKLNCAAIPYALIESELFGHIRGSFTGAIKDKMGKFELANTGTIFLDEIGDLPLDMQVKLLRVLQEREIIRIGSNKIVKIDVRVIAATNRNLNEMIKEGTFRKDLFYRLNVIPMQLPLLKDRVEDIPALVEYFIKKICLNEGIEEKKVTVEFIEQLKKYSWPGNIRELENMIERCIALSDNRIDSSLLPSYITLREKENSNKVINGPLLTMMEYDRAIIKKALEIYPSFNQAAKALGITHRTVSMKASKYNIKKQ
ncbi:MAG: sigma 54-interacting transcriptional regulator [Bacillota bacterium]|nr:sigma 54-interacting transcriptional regulator [Bacillota bacterium]